MVPDTRKFTKSWLLTIHIPTAVLVLLDSLKSLDLELESRRLASWQRSCKATRRSTLTVSYIGDHATRLYSQVPTVSWLSYRGFAQQTDVDRDESQGYRSSIRSFRPGC